MFKAVAVVIQLRVSGLHTEEHRVSRVVHSKAKVLGVESVFAKVCCLLRLRGCGFVSACLDLPIPNTNQNPKT